MRTSLGLGSSATYNAGTGPNEMVKLDGSSRLPNVDGSQLTNLPSSGGGFTYSAKTASFSAALSYHYSVSTSGGAVVATLPAASSGGSEIRFKLMEATSTLTITPATGEKTEGTINASVVLSVLFSSVTLVDNGTDGWEVV